MTLKFFVLLSLLAFYRSEVVSGSGAVLTAPLIARVSDATYDPLPQYTFGYDVQDALTGDSKSQIESRNGDVVVGQYSLNDPDGTRRIVDYASDPINGFNAIVRKAPLVLAAPAVAVAPVVAAAPVAPAVEPVVAKAVAPPLVEPVAARAAVAPQIAKAAPPPPAARTGPLAAAEAKAAPLARETAPLAKVPPAPALAYSGLLAPLAYNLW